MTILQLLYLMLFNNIFRKRPNAVLCCFTPLVLFPLLWNASSFSRAPSRIIPCDTLVLNHNVAKVRSFYSSEEKEQVNIYFYKNQSGKAVLNYCVGSLNPKTSFILDNAFSNIIIENKSNALVQFRTEPCFYRINNSSFILDTLQLKMRQENSEFFTINTSPYFYYIPVEKDSGILFCESFLISESNYKLNTLSRKNAFSRPIYTEFSIGKNTVSQRGGIGRFPKTHLDEDTVYYNYWYWVAPNKNLELATMFWFIDSIYVIDTKTGKQNSYFFKSKYQQHVNHTIDPDKYFDYTYLSKVGYEYLFILPHGCLNCNKSTCQFLTINPAVIKNKYNAILISQTTLESLPENLLSIDDNFLIDTTNKLDRWLSVYQGFQY